MTTLNEFYKLYKLNYFNSKIKKMTKQEFLDKEHSTNKEWVTVQLLTGISKTDLNNIHRQLKKLNNLLYKSQSREMSLMDLLACSTLAITLYKNEENGNNESKLEIED